MVLLLLKHQCHLLIAIHAEFNAKMMRNVTHSPEITCTIPLALREHARIYAVNPCTFRSNHHPSARRIAIIVIGLDQARQRLWNLEMSLVGVFDNASQTVLLLTKSSRA